jgi:sugar transferase (PEP-CTERM/EpsH1 system associated)
VPLHVTHVVLSLDVGGLERNVINQVHEGQKLGQRVSIVCVERPGALAHRVAAMGATLVSLDKRAGLRPIIVRRVMRALEVLRPQVVHTHQLATLLYGGVAARLLRIPLVVHTEHGQEQYASRLRTRMLGRIAGSFSDRFYCLTADTANQIRNRHIVAGRKVRIIQNGINVAQFTECCANADDVRRSLGVALDAPLIGTVGRLTEIKQQDVLLRAFAKVRLYTPDAHLVLVGDGPMREELRQLAVRLGVDECVHFAGYQPDAGPFYQAMDIFALTSRSEGMPQAVLEASVTGLPVVASAVGGLPELIDNGLSGMLFPPGDDAVLAQVLRKLITNPEEGRRMGAAARARVESAFHVGRMAAEYHRDFLELLRRKIRTRGARDWMLGFCARCAVFSEAHR